MKQIAVRIGGFVVNAGSQTIVLDRNVDVEKSNARSGNFPGKLESRMKSIYKLDESVELGLIAKTTTLHVHYTLWFIFLPSLHD